MSGAGRVVGIGQLTGEEPMVGHAVNVPVARPTRPRPRGRRPGAPRLPPAWSLVRRPLRRRLDAAGARLLRQGSCEVLERRGSVTLVLRAGVPRRAGS